MKKILLTVFCATCFTVAMAQDINQNNQAHHPDKQDYVNKNEGLNDNNGVMGTGTITTHRYTNRTGTTGKAKQPAKRQAKQKSKNVAPGSKCTPTTGR